MQHFLNLVQEELESSRRTQPPIASFHEGFAVILEELYEFWSGVRMKEVDRAALLSELVQIAAMAMRAAEDTGLLWDGNAREPRKETNDGEQQH